MKKKWTIEDLNNEYNLDLDDISNKILSEKAERILIQFPDGLKQYAKAIVDHLEEKTKATFIIWIGSCFGACDYPVGIEGLKCDLMIQIGHSSLMPSYLA